MDMKTWLLFWRMNKLENYYRPENMFLKKTEKAEQIHKLRRWANYFQISGNALLSSLVRPLRYSITAPLLASGTFRSETTDTFSR
jgi:hypothetical protein